MGSRRFFWNVMWRLSLIILSSFGFIWLLQTLDREFIFTLVTGMLIISMQVILLTRYVMRLARIMEQLLSALSPEAIPEMQFRTGRTLFRELKEASNSIRARLKAGRLEKVKYHNILDQAFNEADMALLCFFQNGEVFFLNETAKNLLSRKHIGNMDQIKAIHSKLWTSLTAIRTNEAMVIKLGPARPDGVGYPREQLFSLRLKEVRIFEDNYRLFFIHNIQEELHKNEADSWQKIIRVLTHEIMNAVAPMLSMAKSMQAGLEGDREADTARIRKGLKVIEATGQGLIHFTEEYRRLSLLPGPEKVSLQIADVFREIMLLVEEQVRERSITAQVIVEDGSSVIMADKQQLEMMLLNLVNNSFDALMDRHKDRQLHIKAEKEQDRILLRVWDNGSGIKGELLDQVFVPFFSTKEKGSGIGLSLVRQIMHLHGGSVYLESVPREYTRVTLVFPCA